MGINFWNFHPDLPNISVVLKPKVPALPDTLEVWEMPTVTADTLVYNTEMPHTPELCWLDHQHPPPSRFGDYVWGS